MGKQALDGKRLTAFGYKPENLVVIGHDTKDGPEHELYDPRVKLPLRENMIVSIMHKGVLEPVRVRKNKETGAVEVAAGRRRVLHAREANKRLKKDYDEDKHYAPEIEVPCIVANKDAMGDSIAENEIREDDPPSVKAEKLQRYLAQGHSEEEAAVAFGVTMQSIRNWLKMDQLDSHVIKAIDRGDIKASAAWNLASLPKDEQRAELEKQLSDGAKVTAKAARKGAKKRKSGEEDYSPGKRVVNRVLRLNKKAGNVLPDDFVRGVLWVFGETNPSTIGGLTKLIREAKGEKE